MKTTLKQQIGHIFICVVLAFSLFSCKKENDILKHIDKNDTEEDITLALVDVFTTSVLKNYYLWIDDPGRLDRIDNVFDPDTCRHPKAALSLVLHPDDRWTSLYDNVTEVFNSQIGVETSFGMDLTPYKVSNADNVYFVVNFVYSNSPAEAQGIKRGDIILGMDNIDFTTSNYKDFYSINQTCTFQMGKIVNKRISPSDISITMTPVVLTFDPVICTETFNIGKKKVGYLAYSQFTQNIETLQYACQSFKLSGIDELILDLRYNGGGLVTTCLALASMIAPEQAISSEDVFKTNIYNKTLTDLYKSDSKYANDLIETFDKKYLDHNLNLKKMYVLTSRYTASASEALIVGLQPYMDITIIGEQTHGKFCTGMTLSPKNIFKSEYYDKYKSYFKDWGIYVMIGSFADKNGKNASRPNGFIPQYTVTDYPIDACPLGDENEVMLRTALELAAKEYPAKATTRGLEEYESLQLETIEAVRPCYNIATLEDFKKLEVDL